MSFKLIFFVVRINYVNGVGLSTPVVNWKFFTNVVIANLYATVIQVIHGLVNWRQRIKLICMELNIYNDSPAVGELIARLNCSKRR